MKTNQTIRKLPAQSSRVETGPVQFGDDWPGVFIRGDNAGYYALVLCGVLANKEAAKHLCQLDVAALTGLASDLASCVIGPAGELLKGGDE